MERLADDRQLGDVFAHRTFDALHRMYDRAYGATRRLYGITNPSADGVEIDTADMDMNTEAHALLLSSANGQHQIGLAPTPATSGHALESLQSREGCRGTRYQRDTERGA
jgi:hypothetical protein